MLAFLGYVLVFLVGALAGAGGYNSMLKNDPDKLRKLLDKASMLDDKVHDSVNNRFK